MLFSQLLFLFHADGCRRSTAGIIGEDTIWDFRNGGRALLQRAAAPIHSHAKRESKTKLLHPCMEMSNAEQSKGTG